MCDPHKLLDSMPDFRSTATLRPSDTTLYTAAMIVSKMHTHSGNTSVFYVDEDFCRDSEALVEELRAKGLEARAVTHAQCHFVPMVTFKLIVTKKC